MSLNVPITVRIGSTFVTGKLRDLEIRKEAIGGVKSITLTLDHPLDSRDRDLTQFARVYVYDSRSGETIAEGRLSDTGRTAGGDGQTWQITAFGPAQHASDINLPYIPIAQTLEWFVRAADSTKNASTQQDEKDADNPTLDVEAREGKTITTAWQGGWVCRAWNEAGHTLGRIQVTEDSGSSDADFRIQVRTANGTGGAFATADDRGASTSASTRNLVAGTDFTAGDDIVELRAARINTSTTGGEAKWFRFRNLIIRARLRNADGTAVTSYANSYVLAHQVVNDLLGRALPQFDGALASVDTTASYQIDQLAYPDGVTPEQVLTDVMALEPAYRWYGGPSTVNGLYSFTWAPWPTTVRYEWTLTEGDFPVSGQELYNNVVVRWRKPNGQVKSLPVSGSCPMLDNQTPPIIRTAILDLADEIGSPAAAARRGANFLADHRVPANKGTLTINKPIRDLATSRWVDPFALEAGELIRVRGIESYPDALNASSNDGLTVFRIQSSTYRASSDSASLELDSDSRTIARRLAKLATRRHRKR